jgi:hypothetical protein
MRRGFLLTLLIATCALLVLAGCQSAEEPLADSGASVQAPVASPPADPIPEPAGQNAAGDTSGAQPASPTPDVSAQFSPPFPNRLELFEPPKRAQGAARQSDVEGQSVELKGFVNVDQPRALLAIDGVIAPIAEGGEKYGVQVIAIQPPSVVLQRGRSRWTATLE